MIRRLLALCLVAGCATEAEPAPDGIDVTAHSDLGGEEIGAPDAAPDVPGAPLAAAAGPDQHAEVGAEVVLDGSASTGAVSYQWSFGDGRGQAEPRPGAVATVSYDDPGRYKAVLTVRDSIGLKKTDAVTVTVTAPAVFAPRPSSTITITAGGAAVVSPDTDELTLLARDGDAWSVTGRIATPAHPRTVSSWGSRLAVVCQDAAVVWVLEGEAQTEVPLPAATAPFGATWTDAGLFVSLQATGQLARVTPDLAVVEIVDVIEDARGVAALPDGRVAVSRWRSPDERGEIGLYDPVSGEISLLALGYDPQPPSDTEIGGVPSYLGPLLVSPSGLEAAVPSLQANHGWGAHLGDGPLQFDHTLRAVVSFVDLTAEAEDFARRKQFDSRGFANAGAWSPRGDYLYTTMRGSRAVERLDALTGTQAGTLLDVGFAPEGLAVTPDGRYLLVDATLSREVRIYALEGFTSAMPPAVTLPTVAAEPLPPALLQGKRLFNDSLDPRLSRDGYMACAHCHLDGGSDRRVWDFTDRGEGLRNTHSLLGHAGLGDGPVHWSANFDEIHDFEHDLRGPFGGRGLMDDADFEATRPTLGEPKAGLSADLDALAAYVASLDAEPPSPFRLDGALSQEAQAGKALFESDITGCTACHAGPRLTDSGWLASGEPVLHDVGTLTEASGKRLGTPLVGLDTPTLHGVWRTAPYLHDGSAPTLRDVLTIGNAADQHGVTSHLTPGEVDQLVAYLVSLDGTPDPD